jgi:hypothetical protein
MVFTQHFPHDQHQLFWTFSTLFYARSGQALRLAGARSGQAAGDVRALLAQLLRRAKADAAGAFYGRKRRNSTVMRPPRATI